MAPGARALGPGFKPSTNFGNGFAYDADIGVAESVGVHDSAPSDEQLRVSSLCTQKERIANRQSDAATAEKLHRVGVE